MKDKVKYYDKEMFKKEKNIEITIVLICIFLIGFIAGYACMNSAIEYREKINTIEEEKIDGRWNFKSTNKISNDRWKWQ